MTRHCGGRHVCLFAKGIHQVLAVGCLSTKCVEHGKHSLIYCGLGGLHPEGMTIWIEETEMIPTVQVHWKLDH